MRSICSLFILLVFAVTSPVASATTADSDTLLRVLREELTADFDELQQQDLKPYFMSFRVQESFDARIIATCGYLGALLLSGEYQLTLIAISADPALPAGSMLDQLVTQIALP